MDLFQLNLCSCISKLKLAYAAFLCVFFPATVLNAQSVTIDFNTISVANRFVFSPNGDGMGPLTIVEGDYHFEQGSNPYTVWAELAPFYTGSPAVLPFADGNEYFFSRVDEGLFDLLSIEVYELNPFVGSGTNTFRAYNGDPADPNSLVGTANVTTDGNGGGETVTFSSDFSGITSWSIETGLFDTDNIAASQARQFQLDDIVVQASVSMPLLGDVDLSGTVNFLDISPFIALLSSGGFQVEADIDGNGVLNFLDISPFIQILSGS